MGSKKNDNIPFLVNFLDMNKIKLQILITFIFTIGIMGCNSLPKPQALNKYKNDNIISKKKKSDSFWDDAKLKFEITDYSKAISDELTKHYIKSYTKGDAYNLKSLINKSSNYLYFVAQEVEARNMPMEIIFLPMVESAYDTNALSNMGAVGMWQLGKVTADRYGITQDHWFEGRRDVHASTEAALNYLEFLYKTFDNDWLLALAAYNAGEGRVSRAIAKNKSKGLSTSFWDLKLPSQTVHHVPKILALAHIIKNNSKYDISLPHIDNSPIIKKVSLDNQIDLHVVAKLSGLPVEQIKKYNTGHKKHSTHPEIPGHISLPVENARKFEAKVLTLAKNEYIKTKPYVVNPGDSLSKIAQANKTTVASIMSLNKMKNSTIRQGKEILIPINNNKEINKDLNRKYHIVKPGDSLIKIAKRNDTSVKKLMAMNNLPNHNIVIGKKLYL